jgi:hypothetical protein
MTGSGTFTATFEVTAVAPDPHTSVNTYVPDCVSIKDWLPDVGFDPAHPSPDAPPLATHGPTLAFQVTG